MSKEHYDIDSRDFLEDRTTKVSEYFKKDSSYDDMSEIPPRGMFNESFSSSNFGNNFKASSKPELKNFRQERMLARMSRSAANSPRLDYGRNNISNLANLNKILTNIENDRANATSPLIKRSNSSKSIEDLENQWDHIKKQHNFAARTSLSPNRNIASYDTLGSNKTVVTQGELEKKSFYDVSRKAQNEKPLVSNLLSKVVPQAKINLVQSAENNPPRARPSTNGTTAENKPKSKSPLQAIYDRYSNINKRGQNNADCELNTPDSRSKSPTSNVSADGISLSYRGQVAEPKKEQTFSVQVHAKSKSPPVQGQRRYHSPSLNQYRNLMKHTLHENNMYQRGLTSGDASEVSDDEDIVVKVRAFTKIPPIKLRDMIPDREGVKNRPRETTPVKKMNGKASQKNTPEATSPLHQTEINRSLEGAKISFGMPIKREDISPISNEAKNEGSRGFALPTGLRKNSPNYYLKPLSPSRDIFSKGVRPAIPVAKEEKTEPSVSQNVSSKPKQISVFSLSPIRNKMDTNFTDHFKANSKGIDKSPLPTTSDQEIKTSTSETTIPTVSEKESKILSKPVLNKQKDSQLIIRKSEELKKMNKLNKNIPDKNTITDRRKMLQAEYALANYQSNSSKEISSTSSSLVKQVPGLRIHPSRREERERYTSNLSSNNELKRDSTNVSVDNSQVLNGSHRAHTNIANFMQEHVFGTNSLKSSFKSNESNIPRAETSTRLYNKKDIAKEGNHKSQKYYYLPRPNDENAVTSSKTQELQLKATVSKLIKSLSALSVVKCKSGYTTIYN